MSNRVRVALVVGMLCVVSCRDRQKSSSDTSNFGATNPTGSANSPGNTNSPTTSSTPTAIVSKLTPCELKWGASVVQDGRATYQPNVLVLPHGADAVRSMVSNGFTWTIDSNASGASDIQLGRILFATGRVVGRVLAMSNSGAELSVTLGPVEITDVIKECNITTDVPVNSSQALAYAAPGCPGAVSDQPHDVPNGTPPGNDQIEAVHYSQLSRVSPFTPVSQYASFHRTFLPQQTSPIDGFPLDIGSFKQLAYCCGGLGIKLTHDGEDAKITAYAIIHLDNSCRPIAGYGATHACVHGRGSETQSACATNLGLPGLPLEAQISVVAQALLYREMGSDTPSGADVGLQSAGGQNGARQARNGTCAYGWRTDRFSHRGARIPATLELCTKCFFVAERSKWVSRI